MNQKITILQFLGLGIILLLFWSFQSAQLMPEAKRAEQLANELFEKGLYNAALTKVLEAKTLHEKAKNWEKTVKCLNKAYIYADYISSHQGETYLRYAFELSNQYLSKDNLIKGEVYRSLGEWYSLNEAYDSSIIVLKAAIGIFENKKDFENQAWANIALISSYYYNDDLDNMYSYLLNTEEFAKKHQLSTSFFDAIYGLFGVYYYSILDLEKAIFYNNRSLQLIENKADKDYSDSLSLAYIYNNQGLNYVSHFNPSRAAFCFLQTLNIYQALDEPISESIDVRINYAEALFQLEQYNESLALLENIENIKESDYSKQQSITFNKYKELTYDLFIQNYFVLSQLDSAAFYVDNLIKLHKSKTSIPPNSLLLKGQLLFYQKKYHAAEKILKSITIQYEVEYLNLNKVEHLSNYEAIHHVYIFLGKTLYEQGKYKEALQAFQKSLAINISDIDITNINELNSIQNTKSFKHVPIALSNKAITLEAINTKISKQQALKTYQLAIEWAENIRQNMAFDASKENLNTFSDIYKGCGSEMM